MGSTIGEHQAGGVARDKRGGVGKTCPSSLQNNLLISTGERQGRKDVMGSAGKQWEKEGGGGEVATKNRSSANRTTNVRTRSEKRQDTDKL